MLISSPTLSTAQQLPTPRPSDRSCFTSAKRHCRWGLIRKLSNPTVTSTHLSSALPVAQGGTGSTTQNFITLGGDLGNSVTVPKVESLQGVGISGTPSANQALIASSSSAASWVSLPTAPVSSVFGRTGAVTAQSGDYTYSQVGLPKA